MCFHWIRLKSVLKHSLKRLFMGGANELPTKCTIRKISRFQPVAWPGAIAPPPYLHVDQNAEGEKHYIFCTFDTVLCTGVS